MCVLGLNTEHDNKYQLGDGVDRLFDDNTAYKYLKYESMPLEKVTNDKFTALSISSILMKITITLRLNITPRTPMIKRTALNNKICSMGIINNPY